MTIGQAVERADALKPNHYTDADKRAWLSALDGRIFEELVKTHDTDNGEGSAGDGPSAGGGPSAGDGPSAGGFAPYGADAPEDTVLLAPPPYDEVYTAWLLARVDLYNAELERYNNSAMLFNVLYADLAAWYNRTHTPKGN
jgi:hypothetical protein